MDKQVMQSYILDSIPVAQHMGLQVLEANDSKVELSLPLVSNTNHIGTAFGGSQLSAAAIACWVYLRERLLQLGHQTEIVIQKNESQFYKPVREEIRVTAELGQAADWDEFVLTLKKKSKARIRLQASVGPVNDPATVFIGDYVAIKK